jgi:hypothetical protein
MVVSEYMVKAVDSREINHGAMHVSMPAGSGLFRDDGFDGNLHDDYNERVADEEITPYWDDIRVAGTQTQLGASAPDPINFSDSSTLKILAFDGSVTMEEVYFSVQIPHGYKAGTNLHPHVHWSPSTAGAGFCKWNLEYSMTNISGVFPNVTTIAESGYCSSDQWKHMITELPIIEGSGFLLSTMLHGRLYRDPTDGDDTYEADACFLEFDIHFQADALGSRQEYIK